MPVSPEEGWCDKAHDAAMLDIGIGRSPGTRMRWHGTHTLRGRG